MNDKKMETISFGSVKDYAKVATRVAELHRDHIECDIETSCEFVEGYTVFTAKVTTEKGVFNGHSLGKSAGQQKAFEKLESIAVGRALAFAGYLASGEIATYEEMADLENAVTPTQLNSLILKYASETPLEGLSRAEKTEHFNKWCRGVIGEDVDYRDPNSWEADWMKTCWQEITGVSSDVPFEE